MKKKQIAIFQIIAVIVVCIVVFLTVLYQKGYYDFTFIDRPSNDGDTIEIGQQTDGDDPFAEGGGSGSGYTETVGVDHTLPPLVFAGDEKNDEDIIEEETIDEDTNEEEVTDEGTMVEESEVIE